MGMKDTSQGAQPNFRVAHGVTQLLLAGITGGTGNDEFLARAAHLYARSIPYRFRDETVALAGEARKRVANAKETARTELVLNTLREFIDLATTTVDGDLRSPVSGGAPNVATQDIGGGLVTSPGCHA